MDSFYIRQACYDDIEDILKINDQLEYDKWDRSKFFDILEHRLEFYVCCADNQIVGYIIGLLCLDELKIINLVVDCSYRNIGIANNLIKFIISKAQLESGILYAMLEVDVNNIPALKLYISNGFRILCVRKNYYSDKCLRDAYLMQMVMCDDVITNNLDL